jgi:hypothetical protein
MKYVLEDLLKVRDFRETSAGNEVKKKKGRLLHAERVVKAKEDEVSDYHSWRLEKEESMYEEVKNKQITLQDLDGLKFRVASLRENEAALENDLLEAERDRNLATEELEKAQSTYRLAVREKRKIEEHKKIWLGDMQKEEERAQDKEMEEFQKQMKSMDEMESESDENF